MLFIGATTESAGVAGFVPAPKKDETNLFLKSDGTWSAPAVDHTILTLENKDKSSHSDLLNTAQANFTPVSGDIIIIKDLIINDKWQYTAYVYDNGTWHAMDGNYDAENVYFSEDLITTTAIGNIELTDGQATIAAAGKNLKEVFETIFVDEKDPEVVEPEVTLTFTQGNKGYEVGSSITPTYSATLSAGSYSYGPETGITATSWEISDSEGNTASAAAGSMPTLTVVDGVSYTITAKANYDAGEVPVTNLGNDCMAKQIAAGSKSATSLAMTGYRNSFYGTLTEKSELTSDVIRGLKASGRALSNGSTINVNVPVGALRVVIAYPATLRDMTQVLDQNDSNSNIISGFQGPVTVAVNGANAYEAIDYKVYYIDFANPYDAANIFKVTI